MKKFLFLALILIASCEKMNDAESTIKFFKCLLLDSDVTFNHVKSFIDAIERNDPVKLVSVFTTIFPAISAEASKCKGKSNEEVKVAQEKEETKMSIKYLIIKFVEEYLIPILKKIKLYLAKICKMVFPESKICNILNLL